MTGRRLAHYDLLDEISRGGMGVVYRAVDVNLGREVAIKVLPDAIVHDPGRRARLLQEARAAATLEHPHVAVIHEVGDADGVTFIAMELIRGEKLSDTLARGPLPQGRAVALAIEIAEGLARAHEKALVHRDLKPANVMVTDEGHAKIIDFGLAKLVETADAEGATVSVAAPRTDAGLVLGTAAYMSPEQARGLRVDHRTDVFALGVTLYEMLTARRAFHGQSTLDTMQAVLTQPVPPLPSSADASPEASAELQRIIAKCTEKDPDDRYQGMKDLAVDLRAARRRLESFMSATPPTRVSSRAVTQPSRRFPAGLVALGTAAVIVAGATLFWWNQHRVAPPSGASGKQAVAVLYFENNTGDRTLDWMRTGLTDMLVTDLSQSPDIEVVGTDRVVQILQEMRRADDRVLSADVVQAVANRAHVDSVVIGSYVKAGDTIRISARLQDARTGRIVRAERVEGPGQSAVFQLVDELTRRLKATMSPTGASARGPLLARPGNTEERGLDRGVTEITTSSIDAYRYYAEGLNFHERGLSAQAVPLLEKAIQIDPDFAMALAKLAVVNFNMGSRNQAEEYAKRALAHVERLTPRERYYIEGFYYTLRTETRARGIEAYKQELALYPEHQASRHNLGFEYLLLEQYDEGIAQYEELLRRGTSNPTSYQNLTTMLIATGQLARAREVAEQLVRQQPENAIGYRNQGMVAVFDGHLEQARAAFEKSHALDPLDFQSLVGERNVATLQERWSDVEAVNEELTATANQFQRYLGLTGAGQAAAARGHEQTALGLWERAAGLAGLAPAQRAIARAREAVLLLRDGKPAAAASAAQLALADGRGFDQEFDALRLLCVSNAAAGHKAAAQQALAQLEARAPIVPGQREVRRIHWARGGMALGAGDAATAAAELSKAAQMLPAHGTLAGPVLQSYADLIFDAAVGETQAGHEAEAAKLLERLQSAVERVPIMDAYARSFFMLGRIYERRGDSTRAREQYAHFLDLWRDGDLERGWIEEAERKVGRK